MNKKEVQAAIITRLSYYYQIPYDIILIKEDHIEKAYKTIEKIGKDIEEAFKQINEINYSKEEIENKIFYVEALNEYYKSLVEFIEKHEEAYEKYACWKDMLYPKLHLRDHKRNTSLIDYFYNLISNSIK